MIVMMLFVMVVDALLLAATGRFLGQQTQAIRVLAASLLGALYTAICLLPAFSFLNHILWRLLGLVLISLMAFGFRKSSVSKICLFLLLRLSLGGVTGGETQWMSMLLGAVGMGFACLLVAQKKDLIPIELTYGGKTIQLTALRDTGHGLRDPVTGKSVLVVDVDTARKLTGLSRAALCDPVNSLSCIPGLRLIPYKTVGNTGFLLAIQIREAKVGDRQASLLVGLSPNLLGKQYQALTGGMQ